MSGVMEMVGVGYGININHECVFIERYIYSGFFVKKERFSCLQVEQDTWEKDNFDDCRYNIMVLVKRQNEFSSG